MAESREQDPLPRSQNARAEEQETYQEEHETTPMSGFSNKILLRHDFAGTMARFWQVRDLELLVLLIDIY